LGTPRRPVAGRRTPWIFPIMALMTLSLRRSTRPQVTLRSLFCLPLTAEAAERQVSGAANSGSEARADAGSRRLHALVRPGALGRMAMCGTRPAPYPAHPATTHVVGCAWPTCHVDAMAHHRGHARRDMRSCRSLTDITWAVEAARITSVAWWTSAAGIAPNPRSG
jgi:hypothetical protein